MAFTATDWSIDRATGAIRYIGDDHGGASPSYATVIEFHRALQDFADDASSAGDDELDITDENPSARSTDNIITLLGSYNIDDNASEHLYDGSVIQASGATIYDGIVNFGNAPDIQVIQNGAVIADDWWNNDNNAASLGLNSSAAGGISHRFMIKVRDGGADTDGRRLRGLTRDFSFSYGEFGIASTARGNNVLALSRATDLNNQTASGTVASWDTSASTQGYVELDVDNNAIDEAYYIEWDKGTRTNINDLYEKAKYITRNGTAETLFGLNGLLFRGVTHEITLGARTGTFSAFEAVSWTGGTGQMLAIDSVTAGTKMWIQLLTGVAPTNLQTITGVSTATGTASGSAVARTLETTAAPGLGVSTGTALLGAYGVGSQDLTSNDQVKDLTNSTKQPPNNVTFSVGGLIAGEDRVLVGPWDGSSVDSEGNPAVDVDQLSVSGALSGGAVTSLVVAEAIPTDTPATGTIRVGLASGAYKRVPYTGYTASTFTIGSTDFSSDNAADGANVWVAYIDALADSVTIDVENCVAGVVYEIVSPGDTNFIAIGSASNNAGTVFTASGAGTGTGTVKNHVTAQTFIGVYASDRSLVVKVRDGGASPIKEFITSGVLGSTGGSVTAIRTSDA